MVAKFRDKFVSPASSDTKWRSGEIITSNKIAHSNLCERRADDNVNDDRAIWG